MITSRTSGGLAAVRLTTSGSGYTAPPTVTVSGGGGTGAAVAAYMAGTRIRGLAVVDPGTGYTSNPTITIEGNAEATAHAYTGPLRPLKFFRSRQGLLLGVDGMGRGIRWDGRAATASPIGLLPPQLAPTVSASTGDSKYVAAIEVFDSGSGYSSPPVVTISGGTPTKPAEARARVANGRVIGIDVTEQGRGYQTPPSISMSGGNASGVSLTVEPSGYLQLVEVKNSGSGYTATPAVSFANTNGLTGASLYAVTDGEKVTSVVITAAGTGATATPELAIEGNASVSAVARFSVSTVSIVSGGQGFYNDASITFTPDAADLSPTSAAATAKAGADGSLESVTLISGGDYASPPTASVEGLDAKASARLSSTFLGKYACFIRYLSEDDRGISVPSSISDVSFVDAAQGSSALTWSLSHLHVDDRVTHAELWRSTGDQEILLYRVAKIARAEFPGTYTDTMSDKDLADSSRDGYGLLPITLPSGQVNARRYGVPPGNFAVAVMFQDRGWYAVDTTGENVNSLWFSEVDEPESVPYVNEMILQESVGDSDEIVNLVPLSSSLLIYQRRHIYKLQYVSQPVIDASMMLVAYRGLLNANCVDVMGGVAFAADSHGIYAYDGSSVQPVSVPIDDYWRDNVIDFSKSDLFFVKCDDSEMVARFFYCESGSTTPDRALCYSVATKSWWTEEYGISFRCGGNRLSGGVHETVYGTQGGDLATPSGFSDNGTPVSYYLRTGNFPFTEDGSRSVGVLYTPTGTTSVLNLGLHYNGSLNPRDNAIQSDRGNSFEATTAGGQLDMQLSESHLGDSVGFSRAFYSGRGSDMSRGGDRHLAVALSGTQSTSTDSPVLHAITIEGVG